jgi:hypothetical protein
MKSKVNNSTINELISQPTNHYSNNNNNQINQIDQINQSGIQTDNGPAAPHATPASPFHAILTNHQTQQLPPLHITA